MDTSSSFPNTGGGTTVTQAPTPGGGTTTTPSPTPGGGTTATQAPTTPAPTNVTRHDTPFVYDRSGEIVGAQLKPVNVTGGQYRTPGTYAGHYSSRLVTVGGTDYLDSYTNTWGGSFNFDYKGKYDALTGTFAVIDEPIRGTEEVVVQVYFDGHNATAENPIIVKKGRPVSFSWNVRGVQNVQFRITVRDAAGRIVSNHNNTERGHRDFVVAGFRGYSLK